MFYTNRCTCSISQFFYFQSNHIHPSPTLTQSVLLYVRFGSRFKLQWPICSCRLTVTWRVSLRLRMYEIVCGRKSTWHKHKYWWILHVNDTKGKIQQALCKNWKKMFYRPKGKIVSKLYCILLTTLEFLDYNIFGKKPDMKLIILVSNLKKISSSVFYFKCHSY
jgi:hypothetical protein